MKSLCVTSESLRGGHILIRTHTHAHTCTRINTHEHIRIITHQARSTYLLREVS